MQEEEQYAGEYEKRMKIPALEKKILKKFLKEMKEKIDADTVVLQNINAK